jgi:AcrR family transcriptional regulator
VFASSGYAGTSLKDVADACGIQAGSLYHHFDSKEAIVIELVTRYQVELRRIGDRALKSVADDRASTPQEQVVALCTAIAECALAHRAARVPSSSSWCAPGRARSKPP